MDHRSADTSELERRTALERYVLPELEMLVRVARSMTHSYTDAEDLVQETLLRAYRALDRFDGRYPRSWLLTIMRNAWINEVRRRVPDLLVDPDVTLTNLQEPDSQALSPEHVVVDSTFDADVAAAFEALPDKFRGVVELVDLDGLSYQEAADALGMPVGTVMSRLHRARKKMRQQLQRARRSEGPR